MGPRLMSRGGDELRRAMNEPIVLQWGRGS